MKTITFYSYKGGVGRSLALANIATRLAEFGRKVCLLDFDLEAPGLHYKFSSHFNSVRITKGIVDYIYQFSNTGSVPGTINEYSYQFYSSQAKSNITIIPAGSINSSDYWKKLSSINWYDLLYDNTAGLSFLLDLKEKIRKEISPDFLLIDSRTGVSEMSGITLSLLADEIVTVAANNRENLEGVRKIIKSISDPNNTILGGVPKVTFVLSRIPFTERPEDKAKEHSLITKIKKEFGKLIEDVNVIHSDRDLEENEQIKIGYEKDETVAQISRDYLNLFEKLTINDLSAVEISRFRDIKDSERLYQKAISENSISKKLEYINKAIEFNDSNIDFIIYRALVHEALNSLNKALEDCDLIFKYDKKSIAANEIKGRIYLQLEKYEEAKNVYQEILKLDENSMVGVFGLGVIYTNEKEYEKALNYYDKMIEMDSEDFTGYNGRANVKRLTGDYSSALQDVYKALELNPDFATAFATLAEINAHLNNKHEFYLNLENALKLDPKMVEKAISKEEVYQSFLGDERFLRILEKYNIHVERKL